MNEPANTPTAVPLTEQLSDDFVTSLATDLGKDAADIRARVGELGTVENIVKGYFNTKSMMGNAVKLPTESSDPAEIAGYRKSIGAPESAEGYTIPEDANEASKAVFEQMRPVADKLHLTTDQWSELTGAVDAGRKSIAESIEQEWQAGLESMTDNEKQLALRGRDQLVDADVATFLTESKLWSNPRLQRMLANAAAMAATGVISADTQSPSGPVSRTEDLERELDEIRADPNYSAGEQKAENPGLFRQQQARVVEIHKLLGSKG